VGVSVTEWRCELRATKCGARNLRGNQDREVLLQLQLRVARQFQEEVVVKERRGAFVVG
jgi:hypothetical protein